ncbi:hypothetical protein GCM10010402_41480 [Actinomadura luteofluorescens]
MGQRGEREPSREHEARDGDQAHQNGREGVPRPTLRALRPALDRFGVHSRFPSSPGPFSGPGRSGRQERSTATGPIKEPLPGLPPCLRIIYLGINPAFIAAGFPARIALFVRLFLFAETDALSSGFRHPCVTGRERPHAWRPGEAWRTVSVRYIQ